MTSPVACRVREQIAVDRLAAKAGDNCQPALLLPIKGRQGGAEAPRAVKRFTSLVLREGR
jgi:hypothetical protein